MKEHGSTFLLGPGAHKVLFVPSKSLDLEKAEEPEIKLPTSTGSSKKHENFREKKNLLLFIDYVKAFDCVDHNKLVENSERDGNTRPPYLPPEKSACRSKSNS